MFEFLCRKFGDIEARVLLIPPTSAETVYVRLVVVDYANATKYETLLKQEDFPSVLGPMKYFKNLLLSNSVAYKFVTEQALKPLGSKQGKREPSGTYNHLALKLNGTWVVLTPSNVFEQDLMMEYMIQQILSSKTSMTIMKAETPKGAPGVQEEKVSEISEATVAKALSVQAALLEAKFLSAVDKLTRDYENKLKLHETASTLTIQKLKEELRQSILFTVAKFSSTSNGGNGGYAYWNNLVMGAGNSIPWVTNNDTVIVPHGGMYLISSRYTLRSNSNFYYTALYVNNASAASSYNTAQSHGSVYYDSYHIDEVFSVPSGANLKLLLNYNNNFLNTATNNKLSFVRLNERFNEDHVGKWASNSSFNGSNFINWNYCILNSSIYTMTNGQLKFKEAGYYYVSARVQSTANSSNSYLRMEKNSNEISRSHSASTAGYYDSFQLSEVIQVNANDWIRFYAEQNGSACNSGLETTRLSVFKVPDRGIAKFHATTGVSNNSYWSWDNTQISPTNGICTPSGSNITINKSGMYFVNIRCTLNPTANQFCIQLKKNNSEVLAESYNTTANNYYDSFIINEVIQCSAGEYLSVLQTTNANSTPCQYANVFSIFKID